MGAGAGARLDARLDARWRRARRRGEDTPWWALDHALGLVVYRSESRGAERGCVGAEGLRWGFGEWWELCRCLEEERRWRRRGRGRRGGGGDGGGDGVDTSRWWRQSRAGFGTAAGIDGVDVFEEGV